MAERVAKYNFDYDRQAPTKQAGPSRRPESAKGVVSSPSQQGFLPTIPQLTGFGKYLNIFIKYGFYLTILCLFSFIIIIVLQYLGFKTLSLLPDDGGLITMPLLPTNRQISYPKQFIAADASANFLYLVPSNYTVSFDVYVGSDFVNQSVPRVILYRSLAPVVLTATDTTIAGIARKMPQTNFILYLDPYTNDLNAVVYVAPMNMNTIMSSISGSASGSASGRPSGSASGSVLASTAITMPSIQNIPVRTPFRITMMLSDVLLEIYINGELRKSVPLIGGNPLQVPSNANFYGPPTIVGSSVLISNLSYWNTSLTSKSIRTYGKEPFNSTVFANL
jgi:hypothetical protein